MEINMFRPKKLVFLTLSGIILLSFTLSLAIPNTDMDSALMASNDTQPNEATISTDNIVIQRIARTYQVGAYGLVQVTDQYTILNNQSSPLMNFRFCVSDEESAALSFYSAENRGKGSLAINSLSEKLNGYKTFQVNFLTPVLPFRTENITITLILNDLIMRYNPNTNGYLIDIDVIPILPYKVSSYYTAISLPTGATQVSYDGESSTDPVKEFGSNSTLETYTRLPTRCTFVNSGTPILKLNSVDRTIEINSLGYIRIRETHELQNYGQPDVKSFTIRVPKDAFNVTAKDALLDISDVTKMSTANLDGKTSNVTFTFFGTASSNRALLGFGQIFRYTLSYNLPFDDFYTQSISKNDIIIDSYTTKTDFIILNQTINIKLIGAWNINRININYDKKISNDDGITLVLKDNNITPGHNLFVDISYSINFFKLYSRAIIYTFIALAFFGLYVYRKAIVKPDEEGEVAYEKAIPIRELRQFVTLYEERNAIQLDIEKADEDLIRRKIQKKAYNKTVKTLQDKVKQIDEEIRPFKLELLESIDKITKVIQQLDYSEAERISVKDSITLLQDRYKKGKLPSRAAYDRLSSDLIKRIEEIQRKIDRNINELRAYLI
jgi:hypothetical protein